MVKTARDNEDEDDPSSALRHEARILFYLQRVQFGRIIDLLPVCLRHVCIIKRGPLVVPIMAYCPGAAFFKTKDVIVMEAYSGSVIDACNVQRKI